MTKLTDLTIAEAREGLRDKSFSARELTQAHIEAIEAANGALNAFVLPTPERALDMATGERRAPQEGEAGALEGIPLGIKDLFCTKDVRTTACSHILDGFTPTYELTVTANLWAEGAVMLGKLNNDEFAMGSSNETSFYGPVVNPWQRQGSNAKLVPGGSSGGSSAAVAAQAVHGSDRDRYRRLDPPARGGDRHGRHQADLWPLLALGHRGVRLLARSGGTDRPQRAGRGDPIEGHGEPRPEGHHQRRSEGAGLRGRARQGREGAHHRHPQEYRVPGMAPEIEALWQQGVTWLKAAGAKIKEVSLPHTKYALPSYYIVAPAEASSNLARYDGVRYGLREKGQT